MARSKDGKLGRAEKQTARLKVTSKDTKKKKNAKADTLKYCEVQSKHGLNDTDMRWLGKPVRSPLHLRLFDKAEITQAAALKNALEKFTVAKLKKFRKAHIAESKKEEAAAEARKAKLRTQRAKIAEDHRKRCEKAVKLWNRKKKKTLSVTGGSDSRLPFDVWTKILNCLCDDLELEGVRGPSVIARELATISLVNKELYLAALPAFQHLSTLCRPIQQTLAIARPRLSNSRSYQERLNPPPVPEDAAWDAFLARPGSACTSAELKVLHAATGLYDYKSKPIMISGLLEFFGLDAPSRYPARLVLAVKKERQKRTIPLATSALAVFPDELRGDNSLEDASFWAGYDWSHNWMFKYMNDFRVRKLCVCRGIPTWEALQAASSAAALDHESD